MSTSVVFTLNDRPKDVLTRVFASLKGANEYACCFDRTPEDLKEWVKAYWQTRCQATGETFVYTEIEGEAGRRNPSAAFNAVYKLITGEYVFQLSSDVECATDAVPRAIGIGSEVPCCVWGSVRDTGEFGPVTNSPTDPLNLVSSVNPRPLGFIVAFPAWVLRAGCAQDEAYMQGSCYEDDDWVYRLWRMGLPFVFDDSVSGQHIAHPRPEFETEEGQQAIAVNRAYTIQKHGNEHPWIADRDNRREFRREGRTVLVPTKFDGLQMAWRKLAQ